MLFVNKVKVFFYCLFMCLIVLSHDCTVSSEQYTLFDAGSEMMNAIAGTLKEVPKALQTYLKPENLIDTSINLILGWPAVIAMQAVNTFCEFF